MQGPEKRKEQGHASLRTPSRTGKFKPPQTWAACYQAVAYFIYRLMKPVSLEKLRLSNRILIATRYGRKMRSEEHTSELQSLMRISYADFCLKKKTQVIQ